jgi:hypothetical protein
MMLDFFWSALIGSIIGAALGACVALAERWRKTDIKPEDEQ